MDKLKILFVDDEADFRETMGAIIKGWGYDLIEASSGRQAIDTLGQDNPDIIVLDYKMPEMDGVTTLKELRKMDKEIPVIMFTAHPEIKIMKGAEKLGVSAFIPKLSVYSDVPSGLKTALDMAGKKLRK